LKHYGLHFAKYVGRLVRESAETKPVERTLVDTLLVSLSAANTLHQDLSKENCFVSDVSDQVDPWRTFADAAGRFADACEKIDHMEEFVPMARKANADIMNWLITAAATVSILAAKVEQLEKTQIWMKVSLYAFGFVAAVVIATISNVTVTSRS
jgi:hypothetical protein